MNLAIHHSTPSARPQIRGQYPRVIDSFKRGDEHRGIIAGRTSSDEVQVPPGARKNPLLAHQAVPTPDEPHGGFKGVRGWPATPSRLERGRPRPSRGPP